MYDVLLSSSLITLPEEPIIPNTGFDMIEFWTYSENAMEITKFFQQAFERLPSYVRTGVTLFFVFLILGFLVRLVVDLL